MALPQDPEGSARSSEEDFPARTGPLGTGQDSHHRPHPPTEKGQAAPGGVGLHFPEKVPVPKNPNGATEARDIQEGLEAALRRRPPGRHDHHDHPGRQRLPSSSTKARSRREDGWG